MKTAVYTTIHPGVLPFLRAWSDSLRAQTDSEFDLWVGLDDLTRVDVERAAGGPLKGYFLETEVGWTPADIRQNALAMITADYDAVVLVDSDDVLLPERIEAAKSALRTADLSACALQLINVAGEELGVTMAPPPDAVLCDLLVRQNIFGFSNSAYRCPVLRGLLPVPSDCALVDWYLATRACLVEATLGFDSLPRMHYRQHERNIARVLPPFSDAEVTVATRLVVSHYRSILSSAACTSPMLIRIEEALASVDAFSTSLEGDPDLMPKYLQALNSLSGPHLWWSLVANPGLEHLWDR